MSELNLMSQNAHFQWKRPCALYKVKIAFHNLKYGSCEIRI